MTDIFLKWWWNHKAKALQSMHWSKLKTLPDGICDDSAEADEVMSLYRWIFASQPQSYDEFEIEVSSRASFSDILPEQQNYILQYIWTRTKMLHSGFNVKSVNFL